MRTLLGQSRPSRIRRITAALKSCDPTAGKSPNVASCTSGTLGVASTPRFYKTHSDCAKYLRNQTIPPVVSQWLLTAEQGCVASPPQPLRSLQGNGVKLENKQTIRWNLGQIRHRHPQQRLSRQAPEFLANVLRRRHFLDAAQIRSLRKKKTLRCIFFIILLYLFVLSTMAPFAASAVPFPSSLHQR
jgi:hypothetical protein